MLVYVRREPDQAHQTATVEPPPDVKADVEADNLQHTLDCALWALKWVNSVWFGILYR